ncbi:hypothetical protein QAD02_006502 [Eretmocerus hayati]|uniref:Uncharacterized protein n=1 Tax=Eretmocerus hayati TaxID=131215 RepID=A0ACC2N124_9HYME|nr:hypothetical protein QAD02_006502 [Eretmocerus hayati]
MSASRMSVVHPTYDKYSITSKLDVPALTTNIMSRCDIPSTARPKDIHVEPRPGCPGQEELFLCEFDITTNAFISKIELSNGLLSGLSNITETRNFLFKFDEKRNNIPQISGAMYYKKLNAAFDYKFRVRFIGQDSGKINLTIFNVTTTIDGHGNIYLPFKLLDASVRVVDTGAITVDDMSSNHYLHHWTTSETKNAIANVLKEEMKNAAERSLNELMNHTIEKLNNDGSLVDTVPSLLAQYEMKNLCDEYEYNEFKRVPKTGCGGNFLVRKVVNASDLTVGH